MPKMLLIWWGLLLTISSQSDSSTMVTKHTTNCTHLERVLGDRQSKLILCSTDHAVPVQLCEMCEPRYGELTEAYNDFTNKSLNCSKMYFDQDRLNIILTTQSFLTELWGKAYCEDCKQRNNSQEFDNKTMAFNDCVLKEKNNTCVMCVSEYQDLNSYYTALYKNTSGKVCFDLQDSMNRTRRMWSMDFNCCKREFKALNFVLAICSVAVLPVLFYGSVFALTKRQEQNHGLLNADAEFDNSAPSTSTAIVLPSGPPQISSSPRNYKKLVDTTVDSDDDDSSVDDVATKKLHQP